LRIAVGIGHVGRARRIAHPSDVLAAAFNERSNVAFAVSDPAR
jgi:hypothetical protein